MKHAVIDVRELYHTSSRLKNTDAKSQELILSGIEAFVLGSIGCSFRKKSNDKDDVSTFKKLCRICEISMQGIMYKTLY